MVFVSMLSLGLALSAPSTSQGLTCPPAVRRHASVTSIAVDAEPAIRIGHGYDIHRLASMEEAGQPLVIAGVKFDGSDAPNFELGCVAHSDGDVIYHSVVDAILGALTMPDIGQLFPDNDPRLLRANSEIFMEEAYTRMVDRGYRISNVDVTLICEKPKVNVEHNGRKVKTIMMENCARLLRTDMGRINVKARTHEKVDSVGEIRALECHVVLLLEHTGAAPRPSATQVATEVTATTNAEVTMGGSLEM
jgi:2-C-methyl-D-erythritol 2,4-cyclodiphosphate synthase